MGKEREREGRKNIRDANIGSWGNRGDVRGKWRIPEIELTI